MKHKKKYKRYFRILFMSFALILSCLMFKNNVFAWDWDGYYSGISLEEYNGNGSTDYRAHFGYRFTSNSGQLYVNFIDTYTNQPISHYRLDVWGDASGLSSYGWNYISAPNYINMSINYTGGTNLGIIFTNGSTASTSLVMIDARSPTDGMPYKERFEAPLRYSIPSGYTTVSTGWNSDNQNSLSLKENRYQSNGGRGGTIRQFIFSRNGRYDYWCQYPAPENPSTLTNSSFILTGALTSDVGLSTNFPGFPTTTSKTLNIYLQRNQYALDVNPNGGTWNGYASTVRMYQQWGTTRAIPNPTASSYTVTLNANGGSGSTTRTAARPFSGWTQSGTGTLSGTNFTFGKGDKTLKANYSTNAVTLPALTRAGWTHLGWSTSQNATSSTYANGSSYTPPGNITLYAIWKEDLGVKAEITRLLAPHFPVFKMGETGILTIRTTGYAEKVMVDFASNLFPGREYNTEYILDSTRESSELKNTFIIPLYCNEGRYTATVTAYKNGQRADVYPSLEVKGTILDEIRTRIRKN